MNFLNTPLFGLVLCFACFKAGLMINKKVGSPLANPLMIAIFLAAAFLSVWGIPLETFKSGGNVLTLMLQPATAALAVSIYRRRKLLVENFLPIVVGCSVGGVTSIITTLALCRYFGIEETLTVSLLPKSVTTPIAMELADIAGGVPSLTVAAVIFTGIFGVVIAPLLLKFFRIKDPLVTGIALGTACHAIGTAKALELGETQGATSGVSIVVTGIATAVILMFF